MSISFGYWCGGMQDFRGQINAQVANRPHEREWEFSVTHIARATNGFSVQCDSDDQDELKTTFNRLLRHMVDIISRWNSQSDT